MIVDGSRGTVRQAGTVDVEGSIRFAELPSGKYRLRGLATVIDRELILAPGAEASVDLRLEPVGYVRATLRAPAGRTPSD